jgi:hypothetical protein
MNGLRLPRESALMAAIYNTLASSFPAVAAPCTRVDHLVADWPKPGCIDYGVLEHPAIQADGHINHMLETTDPLDLSGPSRSRRVANTQQPFYSRWEEVDNLLMVNGSFTACRASGVADKTGFTLPWIA